MIPQHQHRRNEMALPTNDDFANRELSIDELEAIAAGNWLGDAFRAVKNEISSAVHFVEGPVVKAVGEFLSHPYRGRWL
jgi:hypothetical protein